MSRTRNGSREPTSLDVQTENETEILEDLLDLALVAASKADEGPNISVDDYFRKRMEEDNSGPRN